MADNHICYVNSHHLLCHGDRNFPYFDFENVKFFKDRIKSIAKAKMYNIEVKMKKIIATRRESSYVEESKRADTSVRIADV